MPRAISLAFLSLVVSSVSLAQTQPATAPAEEPEVKPFRLSLRVIDRETREPLVGVRCRWIASDAGGNFGDKGTTDDVGLYAYELPSNKLRHLGTAIRMPGYIPMGCRWAGTIPADYTVEMERGTVIGGRVVDGQGKPVAGAKVTLRVGRAANQGSATMFDISGDWVTTEADGTWTYDRAPAGFTSMSVSVASPQHVSGPGSAIADVKPDDAIAKSIVLTLGAGRTIEGVVVDDRGNPIDLAIVRVATATDPSVAGPATGSGANQTDRAGAFRATVEAGQGQRVVIAKEGYAPELVDPEAIKEAGPVRVTLRPAAMMPLGVVDPNHRPIGRAWLVVKRWRGVAFRDTVPSDANGLILWKSAPADEVEADVIGVGHATAQDLKLRPSPEVQTITLTPLPAAPAR